MSAAALLARQLAAFARSQGIARPTTEAGWRDLMFRWAASLRSTPLVTDGAFVDIADRLHRGGDDFDEMIAERERALHEAGGDDLERDALMQHKAIQALSSEAAFTRVNPPSAVRSVIGTQATVTAQPNGTTQLVEVAPWIGETAEVMPVTCTFCPVSPAVNTPGPPTGGSWRPYGVVYFGPRDTLFAAEVDVGTGTQFPVSGSQVRLQVGMETESGLSASMLVGGMLSFHPIVRTAPVTRTVYFDASTGVVSKRVTVPAFAKSVRVWRTPSTDALTLSFINTRSSKVYKYAVAGGAHALDAIPLSNDVTWIDLTRTADTSTVRLIFELSL